MDSSIQNQLGAVRRSRGLVAAELARRVGVSRQTIYPIESGSYMPNTEVRLWLARALEAPVEELLSLGPEPAAPPEAMPADGLSAIPVGRGHAVRVCQVGRGRCASR